MRIAKGGGSCEILVVKFWLAESPKLDLKYYEKETTQNPINPINPINAINPISPINLTDHLYS